MEQEYNLQCSELNAARERISLLLQQLDRCENIVSITQESSQKEKDVLKHKVSFFAYLFAFVYMYVCMYMYVYVYV